METKKPWESKTLWMNAIIAVLAIAWPSAGAYIAANPETATMAFAVLNIVLRLVTKGKVQISEMK